MKQINIFCSNSKWKEKFIQYLYFSIFLLVIFISIFIRAKDWNGIISRIYYNKQNNMERLQGDT